MDQDVQDPVVLFKALANDKRFEVLQILMQDKEKSVNDLIPLTGLTQSALSQHLARLRACHLVKTRRHAQTIYFLFIRHDCALSLCAFLICLNGLLEDPDKLAVG